MSTLFIHLVWVFVLLGALFVLAYRRTGLTASTACIAGLLAIYTLTSGAGHVHTALLWLMLLPVAVLNVRGARLALVSRPFLRVYRRMLPTMSSTEREALEAGTVWWDGDLFSGNPRWSRLMQAKAPQLSAEEQAFIDGPCEELCRMTDDWDITHRRADLPPEVWAMLKTRGFFAMIIPKE